MTTQEQARKMINRFANVVNFIKTIEFMQVGSYYEVWGNREMFGVGQLADFVLNDEEVVLKFTNFVTISTKQHSEYVLRYKISDIKETSYVNTDTGIGTRKEGQFRVVTESFMWISTFDFLQHIAEREKNLINQQNDNTTNTGNNA
jgi:hypothetical protein